MSLVELLVAMVIGLVLLGGVYQVFTGSTTSSRENQQFSRLQENARFAMEVLGREIRSAGYTGCFGGDLVNNLKTAGTGYVAEFLDFTNAVEGYDWNGAGWTPAIDAAVIPSAAGGGDILIVRGVDSDDRVEITGNNSKAANLKVASRAGIDQKDIVVVSDCTGGDIFQVTNNPPATPPVTLAHGVSTNPGNLSPPQLSKDYKSGAEVYKIRSLIFYIRNNPSGVLSLYRLRWDGTSGASGAVVAEELVQGVEVMQIRYGIDTDGDRQVDSYVVPQPPPAAPMDWGEVIAVRVALLLQTEISGKTPKDTASYDLNGVEDVHGNPVPDYDPINDRRMRRVFKATFTLRNKVP